MLNVVFQISAAYRDESIALSDKNCPFDEKNLETKVEGIVVPASFIFDTVGASSSSRSTEGGSVSYHSISAYFQRPIENAGYFSKVKGK